VWFPLFRENLDVSGNSEIVQGGKSGDIFMSWKSFIFQVVVNVVSLTTWGRIMVTQVQFVLKKEVSCRWRLKIRVATLWNLSRLDSGEPHSTRLPGIQLRQSLTIERITDCNDADDVVLKRSAELILVVFRNKSNARGISVIPSSPQQDLTMYLEIENNGILLRNMKKPKRYSVSSINQSKHISIASYVASKSEAHSSLISSTGGYFIR